MSLESNVKSEAERRLAEVGIRGNRYFAELADGIMSLQQFRISQEQFYFAVAFFSRPMAGLMARLPDYASRIDILQNIVEEHGEFRLADSHAMTFRAFLRSLGSEVDSVVSGNACPAVHAFNSTLFSACMLEEVEVGIACLGIIEFAFAELSARIGHGVVMRGWVTKDQLVHYTLHSELDKRHAEEFFNILEPKWPDPFCRRHIVRGLALGAHAFDRLYRELREIGEQRLQSESI